MGNLERDTALFAAFMLAGVNQHRKAPELCERFGGQIGAAHELVTHAREVARVLQRAYDRPRFDPDYPGVMEYELIEPLGAWVLLQSQSGEYVQPRDTAARFLRQFRNWVRD